MARVPTVSIQRVAMMSCGEKNHRTNAVAQAGPHDGGRGLADGEEVGGVERGPHVERLVVGHRGPTGLAAHRDVDGYQAHADEDHGHDQGLGDAAGEEVERDGAKLGRQADGHEPLDVHLRRVRRQDDQERDRPADAEQQRADAGGRLGVGRDVGHGAIRGRDAAVTRPRQAHMPVIGRSGDGL